MPLVVQKFGGTSVADSQKILAAARKAVRTQQRGNQVVVVVSAMGKNTDTLIELANEINERPPRDGHAVVYWRTSECGFDGHGD